VKKSWVKGREKKSYGENLNKRMFCKKKTKDQSDVSRNRTQWKRRIKGGRALQKKNFNV